MNSKLLVVLSFATGAALGSVVTAKLVKIKYEKIAQEEINSMKEYYKDQRKNDLKETIEKSATWHDGAALEEPTFTGAVSDAVLEVEEVKKENTITAGNGTWARVDEKIYLISPEELGEFDDYDIVGLSYYEEDHVLVDSDGVKIDLDVIGGKDMLDNFGEYEEDVLQVRNTTHRTDYEVYLVHDSYFDVHARD